MAFDPDAYLAEKEKKAFDPDAYLAEKEGKTTASEIGQTESAALGAVQGATLGFADEAEGAVKALGQKYISGDNIEILLEKDMKKPNKPILNHI
jgi:hypothetical protein